MDRWLDSLSEDWVSQPRSSQSGSILDSPSAKISPHFQGNGSQSRIPRFKHRSVSNLITSGVKEIPQKPSLRRSGSGNVALRGKTLSNLNASQKRPPNGQVNAEAASMVPQGEKVSAKSNSRSPQNTVQIKPSPAKGSNVEGTSEWKRRLLKENVGKGDLFSPIGLESVFKPPTIKSQKHDKPSQEKNLEHSSSSPPAQLSRSPRSPTGSQKIPAKSAAALRSRVEFVGESARELSPGGVSKTPSPSWRSSSRRSVGTRGASMATSDGITGITKTSGSELHDVSTASNHPILAADVGKSAQANFDGGELEHSEAFTDQENVRNENLSLCCIPQRRISDDYIESAATDVSMQKLRSQMDKLRLQQQNVPGSRSSDHDIDYSESKCSKGLSIDDQIVELTSQSLPDDLSMGTDAFVANGGFVSLHRGSYYSNNGSFQKRPLSPSLLPDGPRTELPSASNTVPSQPPERPSKFLQTKSKTPPSPPQTPRQLRDKDSGGHDRTRSSGSPLKLFDKYDTFTNDRLVRRMSKFEEALQNDLRVDSSPGSADLPSSPSPQRGRKPTDSREGHKSQRLSSFGEGELDHHGFPNLLLTTSDQTEQESVSLHMPSRQSKASISYRLSSSQPDQNEPNKRKASIGEEDNPAESIRQREFFTGDLGEMKQTLDDGFVESTMLNQEAFHTATGKRLPHSPSKDPSPKRRRTLLSTDQAEEEIPTVQTLTESKEVPHQPGLGRKRKDARYYHEQQAADPDTIAARHILRPRRPTKSQANGSIERPKIHESDVNYEIFDHDELTSDTGTVGGDYKINHSEDTIVDPPTHIVAGALATVALHAVQDITSGSRKVSVTTADFFNEAQQIMQLIRNQGLPQSNHISADVSGMHPIIAEESTYNESTKDEFSRPPSREGASLQMPREPMKMSERAVSHLRKYEDEDDLGVALPSSAKSIHINCDRHNLQGPPNLPGASTFTIGIESYPPNVRIRESEVRLHRRKYRSDTQDHSTYGLEERIQSQGSQSNSGPSTGRSNPTGSSRGSTNKMVIAPETVAHLLSDQIAGMVFDRQRKLWVKRKSTPNSGGMDISMSDSTEEDLFGHIPDLSVDEMKELRRVKDAVSSVESRDSTLDNILAHSLAAPTMGQVKVAIPDDSVKDLRPKTAEGRSIEVVENSSAPSKFSHFASSGPVPATRATSWGDEVLANGKCQTTSVESPVAAQKKLTEHVEEVEHEIGILEGRESQVPEHQNNQRQARAVTVAFSSPLIDPREPNIGDDQGSQSSDEENELRLDDSPIRKTSSKDRSMGMRTSYGSRRSSGHRITGRRMSITSQSYLARPMSRLDEQDEMSVVHCSINGQPMDLAISTPLPLSKSLIVPPMTAQRSSVALHLSPLPDFTVHQIDRPIDGEIDGIPQKSNALSVLRDENRLSFAAQDLVRNLTDLEPYEPYWDHIRSIELQGRNLKTLHMLDEFCGRVGQIDVSDNLIGELDGIPATVRQLNIRGNCLSDLAAWGSLGNLQYLDVSGNKITNVKGFQSLVHLRALNADNNNIESLTGLEDLDALIHLSLRGNKLANIDFDSFRLYRLTNLDLSNNKLVQLSNVHNLTALETCDLDDNDLETLDFSISFPLRRLKKLSVSNNRLSFIDLVELPFLRSLNIDKNSLASIEGLDSLKHLETLSWREQTLVPAYGYSELQYQHCHEIVHVYLSGNNFSSFAPSMPFLNLHVLELASIGLQILPPDLGVKCPNVRTLNLNYNAIRDLRPLLGIMKLQSLHIAGNRISRLRRTAAVLDHLGEELREADLRNNPLTVGFYTPQEPAQEEECMALQRLGSRIDNVHKEFEDRTAKAYCLPLWNESVDNVSRERLDEDTKLRRRVYEMLMANACKSLEHLDGLKLNRRRIGDKDGVWERLVELGVLKEKDWTGKATSMNE